MSRDFLTRAREQGYEVPAQAMVQALDNLQNALGYDIDIKDRGNEIAYALYVLARNKKASISDLRYYSDTKLEEFSSPMAVAQLAAALALYGDAQRAQATFGARSTLGRPTRTTTITDPTMARPCATVPPCWRSPPKAGRCPRRAGDGRLRHGSAPQATIPPPRTRPGCCWRRAPSRTAIPASRSTVDGAPHTGNFATRVERQTSSTTRSTIVNRGEAPVEAVVTTVAAPAEPLPAGGDGFTIERTYYTLDGSRPMSARPSRTSASSW